MRPYYLSHLEAPMNSQIIFADKPEPPPVGAHIPA